MIRVRDAIAEDSGAIAALLTELGYPASESDIPDRLAAVSGAPGRVLVAEEGGVILGVGSVTRLRLLHRPVPVALLSALVVQPAHRGQGVGQALVAAAGCQATAWGCEALELTSRDDRQRAHRFYTRLGFESGSRKFVRSIVADRRL
jgi:GNAT superfamily N-acetyltransferase